MKRKKLVLMAIGIFSMVAVFESTVSAESRWCYCEVEEAGPSGKASTVYITLTDTDADESQNFGTKKFRAQTGREKEMLAIALTAMANDMIVKVKCDPDAAPLNTRAINVIYLCKEW